jgi:hypothetical protein
MYAISIFFAMMALFTNNLGQLIAAMIIAFVAMITERIK